VIFPQVFEQESEKLGAEKAQVTPSFFDAISAAAAAAAWLGLTWEIVQISALDAVST
jgi:hypothetical protein